MTTRARGTFEVKLSPLATYDQAEGSLLGRMSIDKQFRGDLEASSKGEMLDRRHVRQGLGRLRRDRAGRRRCCTAAAGTFILQHSGTMTRGVPQLSITVVPDSGTGELAGLAGRMTIEIADGKHSYDFEYTIGETA